MATISADSSERIFSIKSWLGIHQSPDGDTKLKNGEAAVMRNFRITRDGNLKVRPGLRKEWYTQDFITYGGGTEVVAMWTGTVGGKHKTLVAARSKTTGQGYVFDEDFAPDYTIAPWGMGGIIDGFTGGISFFAFGDKVYSISYPKDGFGSTYAYREWDGGNHAFTTVAGYIPIVSVSNVPAGGGTTLEAINLLTGKRRAWFSGDGNATVYQLPETGLQAIHSAVNRVTGEELTFTADLVNGRLTFGTAPPVGTNNIEIMWEHPVSYRDRVTHMRYAELYNGYQDSRVFLYGDGTNKTIYSGLDYNGQQRADYFPDLNEIAVGDNNTPITALVRHLSKLVIYKTESTYICSYNALTLEDGSVTAGFYLIPANRVLGCSAPGQAVVVMNNPRVPHGQDIYDWVSLAGSKQLTSDERTARRVSDRVYAILRRMDLTKAVCYDDDYHKEYYISEGGLTLVHNYAVDAWSMYEGFTPTCFAFYDGELIVGTSDGLVCVLDEDCHHDAYVTAEEDDHGTFILSTKPIDAYWESGSMDFGADFRRKYSAQLWVGMKPESNSEITVTVQTDKKSEYTEKAVNYRMASFADMDFRNFSFRTNRKPTMKRLKIKAKKFTFYKLIFKSNSDVTGADILSVDIKVRFTGFVK